MSWGISWFVRMEEGSMLLRNEGRVRCQPVLHKWEEMAMEWKQKDEYLHIDTKN